MAENDASTDEPATESILGRTAVSPTIDIELDRDSRLPTPLSTVRSTETDLLE